MKTVHVLSIAVLISVLAHAGGLASQGTSTVHKPCVDLSAVPASESDFAALKNILNSAHVDLDILLYVSHESKMKDYGGALSFRCLQDTHEIYDSEEYWIIYDPDIIQGDLPRDFVFAHEIAHHMNGDTTSARSRSKQSELRADYNGAKYLLQMGWSRARILHALDLLDLSQNPWGSYPTRDQRKANIIDATQPPGPAPPTDLRAIVDDGRPPSQEVFMDRLLNLTYSGYVRLQNAETNKFVCAVGVADPKIPTTRHFSFFDNCESILTASFDLRVNYDGRSGYHLVQQEEPCPEYAADCHYALQSLGNQLQFWNQDLSAEVNNWQRELGDEELFLFEASGRSDGLVRVKNVKNGFLIEDRNTKQLRSGGTREQAAEFRILFDVNR